MQKTEKLTTKKLTTQKLVLTAFLVAMYVVINRFLSISTWDVKIGFSFVPVLLGAIILGPIYGGIIGGLGDFVGAILFPFGPYFPGYTATAFLMGWWYGVVLKKEQSIKNIAWAIIPAEIVCSLILNTLWTALVYGSSYIGLFSTRMLQFIVMSLIKIVTVVVIAKYIPYLQKTAKSTI